MTCLEYGRLSPSEIAHKTNIKRPTVYFYIEKLKNLGLLTQQLNGKRKKISAAPLSMLTNIVEERREKIVLQQQVVDELLPLLESISKRQLPSTTTELYEGEKGIILLIEK